MHVWRVHRHTAHTALSAGGGVDGVGCDCVGIAEELAAVGARRVLPSDAIVHHVTLVAARLCSRSIGVAKGGAIDGGVGPVVALVPRGRRHRRRRQQERQFESRHFPSDSVFTSIGPTRKKSDIYERKGSKRE